ncbi:MAG: ABC-type Fe3+ transport system periplasmic component [Chloroflexi bacterium]|nr:ABC-type Fe3+ transport system periplasmic component [Chloroflexota bacterium]
MVSTRVMIGFGRVTIGLVCALVAGTLLLPPAPSAAQLQWDQVLAAARQEGEVSIYAGSGQPNREAFIEPFERAYPGIKVSLFTAPPPDLLSRIMTERQAGRFLIDVLPSFGTSAIVPLKPLGGLEPLEPVLMLPEVTDPNAWWDGRLWWLDTSQPYTTLAFQGTVQEYIYVNTTMVDPRSFTSYWDLLDPKWKGKIAARDVRLPGAGAVPTRFLYLNPTVGPTFIERLFSEMEMTLSADTFQIVNWVAQGQYPIGLMPNPTEVVTAIEQGLPLAFVDPAQLREGAVIGPGGGTVALMANAPHPNAAKVFINWLLSRDGQIAWQREVKQNSLRVDIPKDGLREINIPKPGITYDVTAATEDYAPLSGGVIRELIEQALANKR